MKSTNMHLKPTATPPITPNTFWNNHTHLVPYTKQCRSYNTEKKEHNLIELFFIYAEFSKNNHLNYEQSISPNKIFEALLKLLQL